MTEKAEIFISYKSERRQAAEHLAEILRLNGYSVWFDYNLVKGRDFARQIDRRIRDAKALIVLWCTKSVQSEWVHDEVDLATELGILVPTKIEPCSLQAGNRRKDYVDLIGWDGSVQERARSCMIRVRVVPWP